IVESLKFAVREGPFRVIKSLVVANKKGGFDCPSCAWPEPDGTRHPAEFCESGAKAIAWEATDKRVGPEFFAQHSVADLAKHNDRGPGPRGRITPRRVLGRGSKK